MTFRLLAPFLAYTGLALASDCGGLKKLSLVDSQVTAATSYPSGPLSIPVLSGSPRIPEFCRVELTLTPSPDSEIHAEVWLPVNWNNRFLGTGNGGFAGKIAYEALVTRLNQGYAVANSDMGMSLPPNTTAAVFIARPERWADWGYRATHAMTVASKAILKMFYGNPPQWSYFTGCSTGGEQGLMEAQRFPGDYDGIAAGAPAHNRTGVHMSILWNFAALHRDPKADLPAAKLKVLGDAVLKFCDAPSGFLQDPRDCHFDPRRLQCPGADSPSCLTQEQVLAAQAVYEGPKNARTGQRLYPGVPPGSEHEWSKFGVKPFSAPPFAPIFQWVFGREWNWRTFDFDKDAERMSARLAPVLNATSPDLGAFRAQGHKLIVYHGWADWLVPPGESIAYYEAVRAKAGASTDQFLKLFMVPGMYHCGGGPGPNDFDPLTPLVNWVEHQAAPNSLTAKEKAGMGSSLLCPYPERAVDFHCVAPRTGK